MVPGRRPDRPRVDMGRWRPGSRDRSGSCSRRCSSAAPRAPADDAPRARLRTRGRRADHAEPDRRDRGQRRRAGRRPQV